MAVVGCLAACGRVGFDPLVTSDAAVTPDTAMIDATTACITPFAMTMGGCYFVVATPATWLAAEQFCETQNAHLITVADVPEHTVLHALLNGASLARGWVGYSDRVAEGTFRWVSPPGVDPTSDLCFLGASPANTAAINCMTQEGPDHCVDWAIFDCAMSLPYVCERDNRAIDHGSY